LLSRVLIWAAIQEEFWNCSSNSGLFLLISHAARLTLMTTGINSASDLTNWGIWSMRIYV
jgi:hypothetical protein